MQTRRMKYEFQMVRNVRVPDSMGYFSIPDSRGPFRSQSPYKFEQKKCSSVTVDGLYETYQIKDDLRKPGMDNADSRANV